LLIRTHLGKSRVRESRMLGSVGAKLNGLATRPSPTRVVAGVTSLRTHYVPSGDGQRFLVNMASDVVASPITVVVNWTATLTK
jgi:hypothetical protein